MIISPCVHFTLCFIQNQLEGKELEILLFTAIHIKPATVKKMSFSEQRGLNCPSAGSSKEALHMRLLSVSLSQTVFSVLSAFPKHAPASVWISLYFVWLFQYFQVSLPRFWDAVSPYRQAERWLGDWDRSFVMSICCLILLWHWDSSLFWKTTKASGRWQLSRSKYRVT